MERGKVLINTEASRIAKPAMKQGWTNKDSLDHMRLVGHAEKKKFFLTNEQ